ncbi:hypothetical protein Trydic_g6794 [Trypoxylus dichotomus]
MHYDRRARDLEDLEKGERVKVKISLKDKEWKLGRIVSKLRRPRSYLVQLDTGTTIERNRRYILKLNDYYQLEYQNQIDYYLSNTEEASKSPNAVTSPEIKVDNDDGSKVYNDKNLYLPSTSGIVNNNVVTRSGRIVKPPKRFY